MMEAAHTGEREGKAMGMKWYVVHTYSGHENKARLSLQERVKQMGKEAQFGQILIPTESCSRWSRGSAAPPRASSTPAICSCRWI